MSTSLSWRTLVRLAYDPCAKISMVFVLSLLLPSIAFRTARTALSHFSRSVEPGAPPQEQKTSSHLRFSEGAVAISFLGSGTGSRDDPTGLQNQYTTL